MKKVTYMFKAELSFRKSHIGFFKELNIMCLFKENKEETENSGNSQQRIVKAARICLNVLLNNFLKHKL